MAGAITTIEPREVPTVETKYRRIVTPIPAPGSVETLRYLRDNEPISMGGQPPIVWDCADGFQVHDAWGNMWIDWSSGVLVTNSGHGNPEIIEAIVQQAQHGLIHSYCFPNEPRRQLVEEIRKISPPSLSRVFLLTTGSDATENTIKLARTWGQKIGGRRKINFVGFERAFHGRSLGAQQAGGIPALKSWIGNLDPGFINVPFPDGFRTKDTSFELFERTLAAQNIEPDTVCGVMTEAYQGGGADFAPLEYVQELRRWCDRHGALLIMDEVQGGLGRTGRMFAHEHYGIVPDLMCLAKGLSGGMPISAVVGREDVMNQYGPGEMTSTHSGNPVCSASAVANIRYIVREKLVENAARVGGVLHDQLSALAEDYSDIVGAVHGKGLVAGVMLVKPGGEEPNADLANRTVLHCVEKGVLMFSPVGYGGATVKIGPPLVINEEATLESVGVLREALDESLADMAY